MLTPRADKACQCLCLSEQTTNEFAQTQISRQDDYSQEVGLSPIGQPMDALLTFQWALEIEGCEMSQYQFDKFS